MALAAALLGSYHDDGDWGEEGEEEWEDEDEKEQSDEGSEEEEEVGSEEESGEGSEEGDQDEEEGTLIRATAEGLWTHANWLPIGPSPVPSHMLPTLLLQLCYLCHL